MYEPTLRKVTVSEFLGSDLTGYCLPTIQRDYVWDEDDIIEMIESLQNGYPTGIITVFETDLDLPSVPLIDTEDRSATPATRKYLLDGQQRLTSLLLIKNGWRLKRNGETVERTPILYNPDNGKFRVKGKKSTGHDFAELVRMCMFAEQPKDHLRKTLESLRKTFLDRPLAFYEVVVKQDGRSEEGISKDMAEIFTRINRAGVRLGNLEMFLSFFASASLEKGEIVKMHKELNSKYGMDLEPLIRFVFSNLGLSQSQITKTELFKKAVENIKSSFSQERIGEVIQRCRECIELSMALLKQEFGISTTQVLPAETVLVPFAQFFFTHDIKAVSDLSESDKKSMLRWFLLASFNGIYSSKTNTRVESDLRIVKSASRPDAFPIAKLLESMDSEIRTTEIGENDFVRIESNILRGTAGRKYLFLVYVILCRNGASDWSGRPLGERSYADLDRHHIFPKEHLRSTTDDVLINHIGNLTFIDRGVNEELGESLPEDYLEDYDVEVLQKHFIPTDTTLWKLDKFEQFLKVRMDLLLRAVQTMVNEFGAADGNS